MCSNCRIEDRAVLKDCIIGADMIIAKDGICLGCLICPLLIYIFSLFSADHRGEVLAKENELTI